MSDSPRSDRKTAGKTARKRSKRSRKAPGKALQPNGSALYTGGVPGNRGGGRPSNAIRAQMRGRLLEDVLPKLHDEWEKGGIPTLDYGAFLARYGMTPATSLTGEILKEKVRLTLQVIFDLFGEDGYNRALPQLKAIWQGND